MKSCKKAASIAMTIAVMASAAAVLSACGEGGTEGTGVEGTYTVEYDTAAISGNVEMNGYLVALECTEKNTLVLNADGTYEYTKYIESHRVTSVYSSAVSYSAMPMSDVSDNLLFSWTSAGDGACTLDFYKDGTYKFAYTTMGLTETGTWKWENWTMTLTQSDDNVITVTMDSETNALNVHYVAVLGGGQLYHDFTCATTVWGAAFGGQGSYTPVEGSDNGEDEDDNQGETDTGPIVITYVFSGTYSVEEDGIVVLAPATACTWEEKWGILKSVAGFLDCKGTETDVVIRDTSGSESIPLNYFGGQFFYASGNTEVKVELDKENGTFDYVVESAFD